jgi:hypothetical protein
MFETKQIIHIGAEIVALIVLVVYFSQKNKKVMTHIEELTQKLEEQEEVIKKHEQSIAKLENMILQLYQNKTFNNQQKPKKVSSTRIPVIISTIQKEKPNEIRPQSKIVEEVVEEVAEEEVEEENLDDELKEELEELEEL